MGDTLRECYADLKDVIIIIADVCDNEDNEAYPVAGIHCMDLAVREGEDPRDTAANFIEYIEAYPGIAHSEQFVAESNLKKE